LSRPSRSELIAGHPVLDLVNTVSWRGDPARRIERVPDFDALLAWSARAGLINAAELGRLAAAARRAPGRGARALADTRRLRERLHQALTSTEARRQEAIQLMWPQLTAALRHVLPEGLPPRLTIELREPNDLTRRLALLALQFLTSEDVRLASACADRDCGWVFLDRSRNRTRRWCSSGDCGNRNRVRQYNARHALRAVLHDDRRRARAGGHPPGVMPRGRGRARVETGELPAAAVPGEARRAK
jgi:predicted RNA-binding Zn ribbon-like protein